MVLAPSDTYIQTLNKFTCLVYSHQFYLALEINIITNHIHMYIHKQNNPILICIVLFLVRPQDPTSPCKPWERLWTWMLGQHAGYSTTSFYIYIRNSQANLQLGLSDRPAKPIYNWVYQAASNQANTLLGLSGYSTKPANSWVYQTVGSQANTVISPQSPQHPFPFSVQHQTASV